MVWYRATRRRWCICAVPHVEVARRLGTVEVVDGSRRHRARAERSRRPDVRHRCSIARSRTSAACGASIVAVPERRRRATQIPHDKPDSRERQRDRHVAPFAVGVIGTHAIGQQAGSPRNTSRDQPAGGHTNPCRARSRRTSRPGCAAVHAWASTTPRSMPPRRCRPPDAEVGQREPARPQRCHAGQVDEPWRSARARARQPG